MAKKKSVLSQPTTTSVGPSTGDLKGRFKARSIPLETDFAALIDVADCGRKATGLSPDFTPATDTGLMLDSNSQLKVQPDANNGVKVDASGVGVVANAAKGVMVDASGVGVVANPAKGVMVNASGVGVNHDATLQIVNANQLGVTQNYVTKSGDSTITGGSLTIASDNEGISFYDGARIFKQSGVSSLRWYKGINNATPQICNNDGSNASNIATENYVNNSMLSWKRLIGQLHDCDLYAEVGGVRLFAKSGINPCAVHVYHVNNTILVDWYNHMATLNGVAPSRQIGKVLYNNGGETFVGTPVIDMYLFPTTASAGSVLNDLTYSRYSDLSNYYVGSATFSVI